MADATFRIEVEVDAASAQRSFQNFGAALRSNTSGLDQDINKIERGFTGASKGANAFNQSLSTSRYALYDVSTTLAATSAALLLFAAGSTAVAVAYERDFAQVVRTTGVVGDAVGELRADLIGLTQEMPLAFGDITQIATLAGQLGVASNRVADFTETTAKLSAVSDLSVDAAATAFGRLDALLPDVQGNYDALGSAIAQVGVNSVATESEIVNISTQISSMGNFAGLTAAEVVGLSGALASIGARPEISRGTLTRLFTEMSKAVSTGSEELEGFARIAGVSADEFASSFGTNRFGPIFQQFIEGLSDTSRTGGDANRALRELGITSVRDVPLLLRLATAGDMLGKSFKDARDGFASGAELNRQYGIISETTAARLQVLANNFNTFLAAIGSANLGPLGDIVDGLSEMLQVATDFISSDIGGRIAGTLVVFGALGGVAAAAAAGIALFGASSIAMRQGLSAIVQMAPTASAAILGTGTASSIAAGQMSAGTLAAKGFMLALKALAAVTVVLALPDIATWFNESARAMRGVGNSFDETFQRVSDIDFSQFSNLSDEMIRFGRATGDILSPLWGDVRRLDESIADMVDSGNIEQARSEYENLSRILSDAGVSTDQFRLLFTDSTDALRDAKPATDEAAAAMGTLEDAEAQAAVAAETFAASMGLTAEALEAMTGNIQTGSEAFFSMADAIEQATTDGVFSIQEFISQLEEQVTAQATFADNLGALAARGATNFVSELSKLGPEGAVVAAEAVNLTDAELGRLEELARTRAANSSTAFAEGFTANVPILQAAYRYGGDAAVASMQAALAQGEAAVTAELIRMRDAAAGLPIDIYANDSNALATLNALQREINSRTGTVTIYAQYSSGALQAIRDPLTYTRNYATGGHITGPGTGTSDSIPARLSNGEYVIRASSVDKYGLAFMHAINSGRVPKFASGGPVSQQAAPAMSMMGGVVELGPKTMATMSRSVVNNIMLDDVALSRAVESGNRKRRSSGEI